MRLPDLTDPRSFDRDFRSKPELWQDRILAFAAEKGWPTDNFHPFADGSNLVAELGGSLILKVFPTFHRHQWESDRRVLRYLQGKLPAKIAIANYLDEGPLDNWTYLLMEKVPGHSLENLWSGWDDKKKISLLTEIGELMKFMHSLPVGELKDLPPNWDIFLQGQIQGAVARHTRLKMPDWFLAPLADFINSHRNILIRNEDPVILTGEYTPFNLLINDQDKLGAMIDFGDAMIGPADYDLLGPIAFLCEGKRELIQSLFSAYGKNLDSDLRRHLFCLLILHRYSSFRDQVRIPDWENRVGSLEELEALILP